MPKLTGVSHAPSLPLDSQHLLYIPVRSYYLVLGPVLTQCCVATIAFKLINSHRKPYIYINIIHKTENNAGYIVIYIQQTLLIDARWLRHVENFLYLLILGVSLDIVCAISERHFSGFAI